MSNVKAIILAAGFGSRLMPLTATLPKGMVEIAGRSLLSRQIHVLRNSGVRDIKIVGGYCAERLDVLGLPVIINPAYDSTNMVASLMCAQHLLDGSGDVIIAYGDIVYEPKVLATLLATEGDIVVVADRNWRALWEARMDDPTGDVESFRVGKDGSVVELGRKPGSLNEVEGQYIGLIKISARCQQDIVMFYRNLDRNAFYDNQPFDRMYMTSFIQSLIDKGWVVKPAWIEGGWLEVDTLEDLGRYHALHESFKLEEICKLSLTAGLASIRDSAIQKLPLTTYGTDDFYLYDFLRTQLGLVTLSDKSLVVLDNLARKIEIAGILFEIYSRDDFKSIKACDIATEEAADALLAIFLLAFTQTGDWRYLNTVLKAIDGVLQKPMPALRGEFDRCCAQLLGEG